MNINWKEFLKIYEQSDDTIKEQIDSIFNESISQVVSTEKSAIDLWLDNLKKIKGDQDESN